MTKDLINYSTGASFDPRSFYSTTSSVYHSGGKLFAGAAGGAGEQQAGTGFKVRGVELPRLVRKNDTAFVYSIRPYVAYDKAHDETKTFQIDNAFLTTNEAVHGGTIRRTKAKRTNQQKAGRIEQSGFVKGIKIAEWAPTKFTAPEINYATTNYRQYHTAEKKSLPDLSTAVILPSETAYRKEGPKIHSFGEENNAFKDYEEAHYKNRKTATAAAPATAPAKKSAEFASKMSSNAYTKEFAEFPIRHKSAEHASLPLFRLPEIQRGKLRIGRKEEGASSKDSATNFVVFDTDVQKRFTTETMERFNARRAAAKKAVQCDAVTSSGFVQNYQPVYDQFLPKSINSAAGTLARYLASKEVTL